MPRRLRSAKPCLSGRCVLEGGLLQYETLTVLRQHPASSFAGMFWETGMKPHPTERKSIMKSTLLKRPACPLPESPIPGPPAQGVAALCTAKAGFGRRQIGYTVIIMLAGIMALRSSQCLASVATGLFNTGVDDSGTVLADGRPDPHYRIVEAPVGPLPLQPVTVDSLAWQFSVWYPNDPAGSRGSKWIARTADAVSSSGMIYVYRTTFTLPAGVSPDLVKITGTWGGDDTGEAILLNGAATGNATPPFQLPGQGADVHPIPFVITGGLNRREHTGFRCDGRRPRSHGLPRVQHPAGGVE